MTKVITSRVLYKNGNRIMGWVDVYHDGRVCAYIGKPSDSSVRGGKFDSQEDAEIALQVVLHNIYGRSFTRRAV